MKTLLTTLLLAGSTALFAQAPEQFEVVKGGGTESLPAAPLVFIAYAFVWVVVFFYVVTLWKRIGRVEREVRELGAKPHASSLKSQA